MRYIKNAAALLICLGLSGSLTAQKLPSGYEEGLNTITSKEILKNVTFLASDSLKGRAAGTDENDVAAMFIASKFKEYGLKTVFHEPFIVPKKEAEEEEALPKEAPIDITKPGLYDNYFQKFNIKKSKLSENNALSLFTKFDGGNSEIAYQYKSDFLFWYEGADDIKISAPVVFAGYGIAKGEDGYNDYIGADGKEIDVKNKVVVVIDGFPQEGDAKSAFSKNRSAYYRNPLRKADVAREKGALAIIVISSPFKNDPPINFKYEKMSASFFNKESFFVPELGRKHIPIIYVSKGFTRSLLKESGIKLNELLAGIDKTLKPAAFEVKDKTVKYEINFDAKLLPTQNVIGYIEGSDPELKNEYVVFGAHYDHVGLGYYGAMSAKNKGKIHPGADDNGSGTCGLIEVAEAFSKVKPRRSVVFIAFTGEENGLLGSNYYVHDQPVFPLDKTIAMLNIDMISRNEPNELSVCGAFYGKDIINVVEESNKKIGFNLFYNTGLLSNASDQGPFLKKNIPILFFFAGDHPDYHTPGDVVEKMDCEKAAKATKLAYLTGLTLATQDAKPAFAPLTQDEKVKVVKESIERKAKLKNK